MFCLYFCSPKNISLSLLVMQYGQFYIYPNEWMYDIRGPVSLWIFVISSMSMFLSWIFYSLFKIFQNDDSTQFFIFATDMYTVERKMKTNNDAHRVLGILRHVSWGFFPIKYWAWFLISCDFIKNHAQYLIIFIQSIIHWKT